jgi:uncharacterized membrane protein
MLKIERSVLINAPVDKVFSYVHEPNNMLEYWPSMLEVKNVKALPNGGYEYDWVYNMAGIHINGHAEWVEYVKNERVVNKNESGIPSTFVWSYKPEGDGTRLDLSVEYTIPGAVLGKLAEPFIRKLNENQADTVMANLIARLET